MKIPRPLLFGLAFLLFCWRVQSFILHPQFLCEDGTVFFVDAYNNGWHSVFRPYAGYFVFYQRIVAWLGTYFPVSFAPSWDLIAALAVAALLIHRLLKENYLMLAVFLFAPFDGTVLATLVNSQWLFAAYLLLILVSENTERLRWPEIALFVLAALTGPFVIVLSPLFLLRAYKNPSKRNRLLAGFAIGCALLHLSAAAPMLEPRVAGAFNPADPQWLSALSMLLFYPFYYLTEATALLIPELGLLVCLSLLARKQRDLESGLLLIGGLLFIGAALIAYRSDPDTLLYRPRYAFLPMLCFSWVIVRLLKDRPKLKLALLAPGLLSGFLPFFSPALTDLDWKTHSACIGGEQPCVIPLNWQERNIRYAPGTINRAGRQGELENISAKDAPQIQKQL